MNFFSPGPRMIHARSACFMTIKGAPLAPEHGSLENKAAAAGKDLAFTLMMTGVRAEQHSGCLQHLSENDVQMLQRIAEAADDAARAYLRR